MATTKTWSSVDSGSWRTTYGWRSDNDDVYQGQWSGYGLHKGLWFFDDSNIRSTLSGKSILGIRLRLTRRSSGGFSSAQTPTIRHHNYSTKSLAQAEPGGGSAGEGEAGEPLLSSANVRSESWSWGETDWVTITTGWGPAIRDGFIRGFAVHTTSNSPYMIFSPTAILEITYETALSPPATPNMPWVTSLSQDSFTVRTNTPASTETWEFNPFDAGASYAIREEPEYTRGGFPGEEYNVRVRARNSAGVSSYSSFKSILMLPPDPPAPTVDDVGETSVSLSVPAQTGTTGYDWQIGTTTVVTNGSRTQTFSGLTSDITYGFRVRSRNSSGLSSYSPYAYETTLLPVPSTPTTLSVVVLSETSVRVSWDKENYATSYDLKMQGSVVLPNTTSTVHTVTGLDDNVSYYFEVRAKNSSGTSAYSSPVYATTPAIYVSPFAPSSLGPSGLVGPGTMTLTATLSVMSTENDGLTQSATWQVSKDPSFPSEFPGTFEVTGTQWVTSGQVSEEVPVVDATGGGGPGVYYVRARAQHSHENGDPTEYSMSPVENFTFTRVKVWNGSSWVLRTPKVWDGSSWVECPLKVRDYSGFWT